MDKPEQIEQVLPPWRTTKSNAADQVNALINTGFPSLLNAVRTQLKKLAAESGRSIVDLRRLVRLEIERLLDSQRYSLSKHYSPEDAAKALGIDVSGVARLANQGFLRRRQEDIDGTGAMTIYYDGDEVDKLAQIKGMGDGKR